MSRDRKAFTVYLTLDRVHGTMSTVESALRVVQGFLNNRIPHYHPTVIIAPSRMQLPDIKALVIYVNLDPVPGEFHSQESAQNVLRVILDEYLSPYSPTISLAQRHLQPTA